MVTACDWVDDYHSMTRFFTSYDENSYYHKSLWALEHLSKTAVGVLWLVDLIHMYAVVADDLAN